MNDYTSLKMRNEQLIVIADIILLYEPHDQLKLYS